MKPNYKQSNIYWTKKLKKIRKTIKKIQINIS